MPYKSATQQLLNSTTTARVHKNKFRLTVSSCRIVELTNCRIILPAPAGAPTAAASSPEAAKTTASTS